MSTDTPGAEKALRIQIVAQRDWLARIDQWRRTQPDLPNRSEAIRRLADLGMKSATP